jgi:putative transposase
MLAVHPSGFYAWMREPLSPRALEDQRQTVLLKQAWDDSGEVYGYRKLHDDLCDLGEDISPNRAWRLARLAGIRAQIGYKKKPGSYGGSPTVVADNTLNRVRCRRPGPVLGQSIVRHWFENNGERYHLHPHL